MAPWALSAAPFMALGQGLFQGNTRKLESIVDAFGAILQWAVVILIALAVVWFLLGLFNFMRKEGEERKKAKDDMLWGIIIIAVMVSVWGLVEFLQSVFGVTNQGPVQVPGIPVPGETVLPR